MSLYEYRQSAEISQKYDFYAIIMAAMRLADDQNVIVLKSAFPKIWDELYARYHSAGGIIPSDKGDT